MKIIDFFRRLFGDRKALSNPGASDYKMAASVQFDPFVVENIRSVTAAPLSRLATEREVYYVAEGKTVLELYKPHGLQFKAKQEQAEGMIRRLKEALHGNGYIVFRSEQKFGHGPDVIGIIKSNDQFDILRCKGTEAPNYDIGSDALITTLKSWHAETPFEIIGADYDWLEARLLKAPADWDAMAEKVYALCPDVVEQGTLTVAALAAEIKETGTLYLWWD